MRIFTDGRLLYGGDAGAGTPEDSAEAAAAALDGHFERLFGEHTADRFVFD